MTKRNWRVKKAFLNGKGFYRVPTGYHVDHIVPLSEGGTDSVDNLQLIPEFAHKQKTYRERMERLLLQLSLMEQKHA
jgi:5-methylcytosine-specific restriction endonuclease McrA